MDGHRDAERLFREERERILATVIRLIGDFELAEEMTQEAFVAALGQWPVEGTPDNPRAWIVSTARHKAIDRLRRDKRLREQLAEYPQNLIQDSWVEPDVIPDDLLRLMFTCCHPSLAVESQIALTLRTLGGLTTEEIARVFLVPVPTMAQRIVRAKSKIKEAGIPYRVPPVELLPERLDAVLATIYLIFTEGYAATSGEVLVRKELCAEAIRLARLVRELLPNEQEPGGLLALMLLHDSRRDARTNEEGDIIPLEEQDRGLWDRAKIQEGLVLVEGALRAGGARSRYAIEAAIAALHAEAARYEDTDWRQIAVLYSLLLQIHPSPVVELNRAVAIAMVEGPETGLGLLGALESGGQLKGSHLLLGAQAHFLHRSGRIAEARDYFHRALELAGNGPERRFLQRRLATIEKKFS